MGKREERGNKTPFAKLESWKVCKAHKVGTGEKLFIFLRPIAIGVGM